MNLTVASIVRNEVDRFLPSALTAWAEFADRIVVLDDGSEDGTPELCQEFGCEVHRRDALMFGNEWLARRALWRLAAPGSDWLLHLDADQVVAGDPRPYLKPKVSLFRVYDMWGEDVYRHDPPWWTGHMRYWWPAVHVPSLPEDFQDTWTERGWHSGHVPNNLPGPKCPMFAPECSILHYAYATADLREGKAQMYRDLAPYLTQQERGHARTITDKAHVRPLPFEPRWRLSLASSTAL